MSPRPGGDVSNSSEFAVLGSGEFKVGPGPDNARALALKYLREHTGLSLLLIYLVITLVARLDDVWFYQRFRVNIFYYSSPADLLLAAQRNPVVWLYFLIPAAVVILGAWVGSRGSGPKMPGKLNNPTTRLIAGCAIVVLTAATLMGIRADRRADAARAGVGRYVSFTRNDGISHDEKPILLGATGQFFFLYYAKRRVAEIVPVENTALMTVDLRQKQDAGTAIPTAGGSGGQPRLSP